MGHRHTTCIYHHRSHSSVVECLPNMFKVLGYIPALRRIYTCIHMCVCLCVCVGAPYAILAKARRGHQIPQSWSYRWITGLGTWGMLSHPGPEETKQQCTIWTDFLVSCRSFLDAKLLGAAGPASLFWAVSILELLSCSALPSPGPMSQSLQQDTLLSLCFVT